MGVAQFSYKRCKNGFGPRSLKEENYTCRYLCGDLFPIQVETFFKCVWIASFNFTGSFFMHLQVESVDVKR